MHMQVQAMSASVRQFGLIRELDEILTNLEATQPIIHPRSVPSTLGSSETGSREFVELHGLLDLHPLLEDQKKTDSNTAISAGARTVEETFKASRETVRDPLNTGEATTAIKLDEGPTIRRKPSSVSGPKRTTSTSLALPSGTTKILELNLLPDHVRRSSRNRQDRIGFWP